MMASGASSQPGGTSSKGRNDSLGMNRRKQTDERDDNSCSRLFSNIIRGIRGFRGFISRPLTDGAPEDPTIHIDTSRTGQDGYTFEAENNKGPEIAKVDKEFENKQIAINTDRERRLAAMRKRLAREVDAKCSNNNTEDNNHEVLPKKLYLCMETKYVGLCIIINNNTKYSRAAGYLHEFFSAEGYEVKFHQYLKKKEIESIFDSAKSKNFNDHGCFVCFVLSTGNHRLIKTADNSSITMDKIVGYFHPKNSPTLDGKPKVFFFQNGIDIVNARNLWNDDERTPFPTYVDAVVVRSTLRDFIDRFITILAAHPRKSLSAIMTLLQYETLFSFTCNEQYQVIRDMTKEVYFTIEKSTAGTSNPQTTAHIHAPTEKKLNAMMKDSTAGPSSEISNATEYDDIRTQEEGSSDRYTETKYTGLCIIINNNTKYSPAAASLREFFAAEGYEVEYHDSLKKEEIESIFDSLKSKIFDDYGCFVCFALSTGNHTHINTADNMPIKMRKIVRYLDPSEYPNLDGKPKIFFFQNGTDFYNAKNLWEVHDNKTTPFPTYADAFVVRSTLSDFIDRFVTILKDHPGKSLSTIMALLQSETFPLFTRNERYQAISTMTKEVYFAAEKSEVKTSNTREIMARIHAPVEEELNKLTEAGPSSDNSNTTPDVDAHMQEEGSSDRTKPKEGEVLVTGKSSHPV